MVAVALVAALLSRALEVLAIVPELKHPHEPTNGVDWILWKLGLFESGWHGEGDLTSAPTSFGNLQVVTFGRPGGRVALAAHGGMNMQHIHRELDILAEQLAAQHDLYVILPNFHSLRATMPGSADSSAVIKVLDELLVWSKQPRFSMLIGKAWGGAMVARYAAVKPSSVEKLTLIGPGPLREEFRDESSLFKLAPPTLLLWCTDDASVPKRLMDKLLGALKKPFPSKSKLYRGGSRMLPEFLLEIHRFMAHRDEL